jgi:hypothetical protein
VDWWWEGGLASSADGRKLISVRANGSIYTSSGPVP